MEEECQIIVIEFKYIPMRKFYPYLLILFGLLILFFIGLAPVAGVCLLLGIVMIIERKWPEDWEADKKRC